LASPEALFESLSDEQQQSLRKLALAEAADC